MRKCGYCGKEMNDNEVKDYHPNPDSSWENDLDEEQCPYCGYHSTLIEDQFEECIL